MALGYATNHLHIQSFPEWNYIKDTIKIKIKLNLAAKCCLQHQSKSYSQWNKPHQPAEGKQVTNKYYLSFLDLTTTSAHRSPALQIGNGACRCIQESHHIGNTKFFQQLLDSEYDITDEELHNFTSSVIACDMQFPSYVAGH